MVGRAVVGRAVVGRAREQWPRAPRAVSSPAPASACGWLEGHTSGMRRQNQKSSASRRLRRGGGAVGEGRRLLARCHGGIMPAYRLQCIGLEGEMARCEELGELLATEQ